VTLASLRLTRSLVTVIMISLCISMPRLGADSEVGQVGGNCSECGLPGQCSHSVFIGLGGYNLRGVWNHHSSSSYLKLLGEFSSLRLFYTVRHSESLAVLAPQFLNIACQGDDDQIQSHGIHTSNLRLFVDSEAGTSLSGVHQI
jgi:hypothetical protein